VADGVYEERRKKEKLMINVYERRLIIAVETNPELA
jgi:hypothetical protein